MTQHFEGPSSAPPTPSVISVTHPSQFIHTHHPRRGSLTPLGLNVISPVPPSQVQPLDSSQGYPIRSLGFNAGGGGSDGQFDASRRDSVASVSSNLTATRPSTYAMSSVAGSSSTGYTGHYRRSSLTPSLTNLAPPANFNASKRRSSLTPSLPTLAAPSSSRAVAAGRITGTPASSRTIDSVLSGRRGSAAALIMSSDARRGSLPHLYYGAWTGPGTPTARESWSSSRTAATVPGIDSSAAVIDSSFKFGNPPTLTASYSRAESSDETAAGSLQRVAHLSNLASSSRRKDPTAFELAEQQEADRQRRAFLAATYGEDSRRARARLSLGGAVAAPGSPASTRRQSLLLWERIHRPPDGTAIPPAAAEAAAASGVPVTTLARTLQTELGRRPSLPINIPMRTPPEQTSESFDDQAIWDNPDLIDPDQVSESHIVHPPPCSPHSFLLCSSLAA